MNRLITLGVLLFLFLPQLICAEQQAQSGKVLWVYDGDTIRVENIGKVRLIGIDTPEKEDSDRDRYYLKQGVTRSRLRTIADEAHQFLIRAAKGRTVVLQTDLEIEDRHGRLLAYVYLADGSLLNQILIEKGLAAVYRKFDFRLKENFLAAEHLAKKNEFGLWHQ